MSLETAIRENTAALAALTAALGGNLLARSAGQDLGAAPPEAVAAYKEHVQKTAASTKREQAPEVDTREGVVESQLDYDKDVKPQVLRLAAKDKAALRAILDGIGVGKGSEVIPAALPEFLAQVQARL